MTSSTRRSSTGARHKLLVLLYAGLGVVGAHLVLEATARVAERRFDAYLWKQQDHLRLFSPVNHLNRGHGRLLIYGPSEAREGLFPEEIGPAIPDLKPYQNSQSMGTLEDGLVVLNYIERAYGPTAIPDALLLGITVRFIADIRVVPSPLWEGINEYSPHFNLVEDGHPPSLVPKSPLESARARWALLRLQPDRYRRGLLAVASRIVTSAVPSLWADPRTRAAVGAAKYLSGPRWPEHDTKKWLVTPDNFWDRVHGWDPDRSRDRVIRELRSVTAYTARHHMELFVVNMPELSWNRELYSPGRYEAYLATVKIALGQTPFLDLRTFLADDEFFDDAHPTWIAGIRVSKRVAAFISEHRRDGRLGSKVRWDH